MKIKVLMTALLGLITISAFAQKRELENAQSEYEKYDALYRSNYTLAKPLIINAKTAIDKASVNTKTAGLPQTFALQAAIYASIAVRDTIETTAATEIATAQEALKKATEADTKKEYSKLIQSASQDLAQIQLNKGVRAYQGKNFDEAYNDFNAAQTLVPNDTLCVLYTALAASNAKNYPAAITNYNKLLNSGAYHDKANIYSGLPVLYLLNKDSTNAIKIANEAVVKYPANADLRKQEIEVNLQLGKQDNMLTKIDAAIKADPNNKALYYYAGLTYSQIAEGLQNDINKLQKADKKAAEQHTKGTKTAPNPQIAKLEQLRTDNFAKAADQYKKALEIDHNYFEAVLNLGYVSMAPAIDHYNTARFINDQKTYDAAIKKVNSEFEAAKPYLLKAVELNPNSVDALTNLKSYYLGVQDMTNANAIQKKIDALPVKK